MALDTRFIATLAEQTLELQEASEQLLRQIALKEIDEDDMSFMVVCNALGWNERRRKQEIVRMNNVLRFEKDACSDDEFARRVEHADAVRKSNATKRDALLEKIRKLQAEIADLDSNEKAAEQAVESAEIARAKLREAVPSHIRTAVDRELGRLHNREENRRRLFLESEIRVTEAIVANEVHPNQILDLCKARFPNAIATDHRGELCVPYANWDLIRSNAPTTLAELQAEFDALDSAIREEEETILRQLDFYIAD